MYHPIQGQGQYPLQIPPIQQQSQQQHQQPPYNHTLTSSHMAQLAQQGYAQQQHHLAAMQAAQAQAHVAAMMRNSGAAAAAAAAGASGGSMTGMTPAQLQQAQIQAQMQMNQPGGLAAGGSRTGEAAPKKKRGRPAHQMIPPPARPLPTEHYVKQALAPPPPPPQAAVETEPWADALDELDPRELAMGRFRVRQDILTEIFSTDPIGSIPLKDGDPWAGFGMDGETLEAKVAALEKENAELEETMEEKLEEWRKRLQDIETTGDIAVS